MTVHPLLHSESMTLIICRKQSLLCACEGQLPLSACQIHHILKPDGFSWFGTVPTVAHRPTADLHPGASTTWLMMAAVCQRGRPSFSCAHQFLRVTVC